MKHDHYIDEIKALAKSGLTKREISSKLLIPINTLARLCKRNNIVVDGHLLHKICGFDNHNEFINAVTKLYESKLTIDEIALQLGTTYPSLSQHLFKIGFKCRNTAEWMDINVPIIDLSPIELEIITGALLGDGYLTIPRKTAYFGYTCHYRRILEDLSNNYLNRLGLCIYEHCQFDKRTNKIYTNYIARSRCFKIFTELRNLWYPNKIKIIPKTIKLTPEICYWWYLGDGSSGNSSLRLCTNGFTTDDVEFLSSIFPVCNSVEQQYQSKTNKYYPTINITKIDDRIEFLKYIGSCRHYEYNHRWIIHRRSGDITDYCYRANLCELVGVN